MAIVAGLAVGWVSLIVLAPLLPIPAAGLLYLFGSRICHQLADRSFHLDGAQLPVCARCVGVYLGAAVGALLYVGRIPRPVRRSFSEGGSGPAAGYVITAAALNLTTIVIESSGLWRPSNDVRAIAGALLGISVALATIEYTRCPSRRPIAPDLPGTPT